MAFPNSPERTEPDIELSHFRAQIRVLDGYTYLRGCERRWADGIWRPVEGYGYYEVEASDHDTAEELADALNEDAQRRLNADRCSSP